MTRFAAHVILWAGTALMIVGAGMVARAVYWLFKFGWDGAW